MDGRQPIIKAAIAVGYMNVRIVYCVPCGHLPTALELSQQLLSRYGQRLNKKFSVTLDTSDGGTFEVYIDGERVFSRHEAKRFPTADEIAARIEERL
ncbi:MAG: Rdx family protein [Aigarchaeota archaeon]|nr:Rdx family protein [Candidatus Pelearchaeum maunauluense]